MVTSTVYPILSSRFSLGLQLAATSPTATPVVVEIGCSVPLHPSAKVSNSFLSGRAWAERAMGLFSRRLPRWPFAGRLGLSVEAQHSLVKLARVPAGRGGFLEPVGLGGGAMVAGGR